MRYPARPLLSLSLLSALAALSVLTDETRPAQADGATAGLAQHAVAAPQAPATLTLEGYQLVELPTLPGFSSAYCEVITNSGKAGGASYNGTKGTYDETDKAEVWDASGHSSAPTMNVPSITTGFMPGGEPAIEGAPGALTYPLGVGPQGTIVGAVPGNPPGYYYAAISAAGHLRKLDIPTPVPPEFGSAARDVNSSGVVVGYVNMNPLQPASTRAIVWQSNGKPKLLPGRPGRCGENCGQAFAINDKGVIVGLEGDAYTTSERAVKWVDDHVIELGSLGGPSSAHAINSAGTIVGLAYDSENNFRGFVHRGGKMLDLNSLIERPPSAALRDGWIFQDAESINDKGEICGYASKQNVIHAVVLKPTTTSIVIAPPDEVNNAIKLAKPPRVLIGKGLPVLVKKP